MEHSRGKSTHPMVAPVAPVIHSGRAVVLQVVKQVAAEDSLYSDCIALTSHMGTVWL